MNLNNKFHSKSINKEIRAIKECSVEGGLYKKNKNNYHNFLLTYIKKYIRYYKILFIKKYKKNKYEQK